MTHEEYLGALEKLGLGVSTKTTLRVLGISLSMAHRYAAGTYELPAQVPLLLGMYLAHGIPAFLLDGEGEPKRGAFSTTVKRIAAADQTRRILPTEKE